METTAADIAEHIDAFESGQREWSEATCSPRRSQASKPRPALVIRSDLLAPLDSTVTIAPLTSAELEIPIFRVPIEPTGTNGLRTRSLAMIDQTFPASTRHFGEVF